MLLGGPQCRCAEPAALRLHNDTAANQAALSFGAASRQATHKVSTLSFVRSAAAASAALSLHHYDTWRCCPGASMAQVLSAEVPGCTVGGCSGRTVHAPGESAWLCLLPIVSFGRLRHYGAPSPGGCVHTQSTVCKGSNSNQSVKSVTCPANKNCSKCPDVCRAVRVVTSIRQGGRPGSCATAWQGRYACVDTYVGTCVCVCPAALCVLQLILCCPGVLPALTSPQVDIVTAGDQVNELHLIVAGEAVVERLASADPVTDGLLLVVDGPRGDPSSGAAARAGLLLGPGEPAGAMAFFTEVPCLEVRGMSVGRRTGGTTSSARKQTYARSATCRAHLKCSSAWLGMLCFCGSPPPLEAGRTTHDDCSSCTCLGKAAALTGCTHVCAAALPPACSLCGPSGCVVC